MNRSAPAYDLRLLQHLVGQGPPSCTITRVALDGAARLLMDEVDVGAAVLTLTDACFYKTMEAEKRPGLWQDVYHLRYKGVEIYIKLQQAPDGRAVVVQFKEK